MSHTDSFGHGQLSNSGQKLQRLIKNNLGLKTHLSIPDYIQRSFYYASADIDKEISIQIAEKAIINLHAGLSNKMIGIKIKTLSPLTYDLVSIDLEEVANTEKMMPRDYFNEEGFELSSKGRAYFEALLIQKNGTIFPKFWPHFLNQNSIPETLQSPQRVQLLDL